MPTLGVIKTIFSMKKQILTLLLIALSSMYIEVLPLFAQEKNENEENLPPSFRYKLKKEVPEIFFDFPDNEQKAVDSMRKTRYPVTAGHEIEQEIDFMKKAVCEKLPNGNKVYRLKFNCDAVFDAFYFKKMTFPNNAAIYTIYPEKNTASRYDTQKSNIAQKIIWGDGKSIIIEYVQPHKVRFKPKIIIQGVRLLYSEKRAEKDIAEEDDLVCNPLIRCPLDQYNINGFPMQNALKDELASSVVKLHIYRPDGCSSSLTDWDCTGTFINSTDKRLYILTANHNLKGCYEAGSDNQVKLRIRFNHEDTDCEEGGTSIGIDYPFGIGIATAMDAFLVARNPDSDMALLEIASVPETIMNLYMASFDNIHTLPSEGFAIHHPNGDKKRFGIQADYLNTEIDDGVIACNDNNEMTIASISTSDANPDGSYFAANFDVGYPAGGSSGSPYFDTYGSIIGQLNGGATYCGGDGEGYISLYGRLWHSWDNGYDFNQNGTVEVEEAYRSTLQPHLDPNLITNGFMPMRLHNYDLAMIDDENDDLKEPNQITTNFFNSQSIINCNNVINLNNCTQDVSALEKEVYKIKITIKNNGTYNSNTGARVEAYWTIASTGEMWPNHWKDLDTQDDCIRGDLIGSIEIPSIPPNSTGVVGLTWTAPKYFNIIPCLDDPEEGAFEDPVIEGGNNNYQICYLARIVDSKDPIIGEKPGPIYDNVRNSNNLVTQNSFLLYVDGLEMAPLSPAGSAVQPVLMLVENNNDFFTNLNIKIDKISPESVGDLGDYIYLEVLLSQELWDKWASTGFKGEGISIVNDKKIRVLNLETAKMLDIPFEAKEFMTLGLKATAAYTSGKKSVENLPNNYAIQVSHEATNVNQKINSSSPCNFTFKGLDKLKEALNILEPSLVCFPNPTQDILNIEVELPNSNTVTLSLFDLQGRKVADISHNDNRIIGKHQYTYNMSNIAKGIYICQLKTKDNAINQKIIKID